jgi:opacity protein-like surface antigen
LRKAGYLGGGAALRVENLQNPFSPFTMKKVLFLAVAAMSLSLASCDSKKEDAAEAQGTAVKEAGEAKADAMEEKADAVRDSTDKAGEAVGDSADAKDPK